MNEDALRAVIRETIARHLGSAAPAAVPAQAGASGFASPHLQRALAASHARFLLPPGDGPCMIEPHVACEHCGFCQSMGH